VPHLRYGSIAPVLIVERVEPTRDFFRDRLGFTPTAVVAHGDGIGFAMLEKDGVTVMIQSHASVIDDVGPDAARSVTEAVSGRGAATLFISVSDVELVVPCDQRCRRDRPAAKDVLRHARDHGAGARRSRVDVRVAAPAVR
jgi:hypothetical protein